MDTLLDELDGSIVDGDISLRDAIAAATPAETIDFAMSLDGGTILLTLGELAAVLGGTALAGTTELKTAHQTVSVAVDEPQGTAAPVLITPAAERPLRSQRTHKSRVHDDDIRFADRRNVDQILPRRSPIRTRVGHDERRLRREDVFRPVQPEAADDWHVAVDDSLGDNTDWIIGGSDLA